MEALICSTDWHIKGTNTVPLISAVKEQLEIAKGMSVDRIFVLGDVFESRTSLRMGEMDAFNEILDMALSYSIVLYVIPGNHDKTVYTSTDSWLRYFKHHPSLHLVEENATILYAGYEIKMLPYFDYGCDNFNKNFEKCKTEQRAVKQILLGHMAVYGSRNNDGTLVSSGMTLKQLEGFDKVLLGHYHNKQKIGKNVYHIPSIIQHNFGEDSEKGFTVLYKDGEMELIKATFAEYKKIDIDLNDVSYVELKELTKEHENSTDNIKFVIKGSKAEIQALDTAEMQSVGIRVQKKNYKDDIPTKLVKVTSEVFIWNKSTVKERFLKFVEKNKYNQKEGESLINKILKI